MEKKYKYNLTPETAGFFEALRLLLEARDKAFDSITSVWGEEQENKIGEPFYQALENASDELFKLVRLNAELNLGQKGSYTEEGVQV
jgi:hypothetical protein